MLLILSDPQYFRGMDVNIEKVAVLSGVDTACIKQYAIYSRGRYYCILGDTHNFWRSILLILGNVKYFRGPEIANIEEYAVFGGDWYFIYYAMPSIFERWMLTWSKSKYHRGSIPLILNNTQYIRGVDTAIY